MVLVVVIEEIYSGIESSLNKFEAGDKNPHMFLLYIRCIMRLKPSSVEQIRANDVGDSTSFIVKGSQT